MMVTCSSDVFHVLTLLHLTSNLIHREKHFTDVSATLIYT